MMIRIMKKGDRVINVTPSFVAIERRCGEVDIIPLIQESNGIRINPEGTITIGYGENIVETKYGDVTVTSF